MTVPGCAFLATASHRAESGLQKYLNIIKMPELRLGFTILVWDGESGGQNDTRNEIDIFVMRDLVPVFVSCKNGEVHKEALYELNTVAEKFGGEYAKKVLVCTYISYSKSSREYILQRARDMKIEVVEDVDLLSGEEFLQEIRKRIR